MILEKRSTRFFKGIGIEIKMEIVRWVLGSFSVIFIMDIEGL